MFGPRCRAPRSKHEESSESGNDWDLRGSVSAFTSIFELTHTRIVSARCRCKQRASHMSSVLVRVGSLCERRYCRERAERPRALIVSQEFDC